MKYKQIAMLLCVLVVGVTLTHAKAGVGAGLKLGSLGLAVEGEFTKTIMGLAS